MEDSRDKKPPTNPYVAIAAVCGMLSFGVSVVGLMIGVLVGREVSGLGLWAIAAMAAMPAVTGVGVAYFMAKRD